VEFNVTESKSDGRLTATRVTKLPHGTVSFERVLEGRFEGVVDRVVLGSGIALTKKGAASKDHGHPGLIVPDIGNPVDGSDGDAGAKRKDPEARILPFTAADMENHHVVLSRGDKVAFNVVVDRPTGKKRAAKISLVQAALAPDDVGREAYEAGPETGIVTMVKNAHCFVRCADRDLRVYLAYADIDPDTLQHGLAAKEPPPKEPGYVGFSWL
jgi:hypothetical protein